VESIRNPNHGKIARYAEGPDYHEVIWRKLDALQAWLRESVPGCRTRGVCDTAPLLERDFARRAGLGWIGKNTMLINKHRGSYIMLGALLTDAELLPDQPHETQHCGTCTRCLEACPTDAFPAPGVLDARKCISYLTIETKGALTEEQMSMVGDWLYGCDICQDVCPWNRKSVTETTTVDAREWLAMDDVEFRRRFRETTMYRSKLAGLQRNAAMALGHTGDKSALEGLHRARNHEDPGVRAAVEWAIEQITHRQSDAPVPTWPAHPSPGAS
jgi:epoxyqueuosine reductase